MALALQPTQLLLLLNERFKFEQRRENNLLELELKSSRVPAWEHSYGGKTISTNQPFY